MLGNLMLTASTQGFGSNLANFRPSARSSTTDKPLFFHRTLRHAQQLGSYSASKLGESDGTCITSLPFGIPNEIAAPRQRPSGTKGNTQTQSRASSRPGANLHDSLIQKTPWASIPFLFPTSRQRLALPADFHLVTFRPQDLNSCHASLSFPTLPCFILPFSILVR